MQDGRRSAADPSTFSLRDKKNRMRIPVKNTPPACFEATLTSSCLRSRFRPVRYGEGIETKAVTYQSISAVCILLLILSQISERLANLMKLWLSGKQLNPFANTEPTRVRNLRNRTIGDNEKEREEGILFVNVLCGVLVASVTLNIILAAECPPGIKWLFDIRGVQRILLIALGGFFLSFGSKFWHDLLDLLFQYKRAKENILDPGTYEQGSVTDLDTHLQSSAINDAKELLRSKGEALRSKPGVVSVGIGRARDVAGIRPVIDVHVQGPEFANGWDRSLDGEVAGKKVSVPIVVTVTGIAQLMAGGEVGGRICNNAHPTRTGTMGCVVRDVVGDERYLLSCYHVMRYNHDWSKFAPMGAENIQAVGNGVIGKLVAGRRTSFVDIAIASIPQGVDIDLVLPEGGKINGWRELNEDDETFRTPVWFKGANHTQSIGASICGRERQALVAYPDGDRWMQGLIFISATSAGRPVAPSRPGDSGSVVHDRDGMAIGMVVAGNAHFTYVLPMANLLSAFDLEIATQPPMTS